MNQHDDPRVITPIPDPTTLTTANLHRELLSLQSLIVARLDAMDKATELLNQNVTRVPTDTDKQISHLKELHDEKFLSVQRQFQERDVRTEQIAAASTTAISAALQAAKEAVAEQNRASALSIAKSETATTKQIDQQGAQIQTQTSSLNDKIESETRGLNDKIQSETRALNGMIAVISSRLDRIEGQKSGHSESWGLLVGAGGLLAALGGFAIAVAHLIKP